MTSCSKTALLFLGQCCLRLCSYVTFILSLPPIKDEQLPKILFLTSKTEQKAFSETRQSQAVAQESSQIKLLKLFKKALEEKSIDSVRRMLKQKFFLLKEDKIEDIPLSLIDRNFSDLKDVLDETEEDVLEFNEIFKMLSIPIPEFMKMRYNTIVETKNIPVRQITKLPLRESDFKTFFIYTEYKIFSEICDALNPNDVYKMITSLQEGQICLNVEVDKSSLDSIPGMKDVAFYYMILSLIEDKSLSRLHTHTLEYLLKGVMKTTLEEDKDADTKRYQEALSRLKRYPVASHPPGLCIIFCVVQGRDEGVREDLQSVKELFENVYRYDVLLRLDPTSSDVKTVATKLTAPRNKFYDSLVVWFMGHGTMESLILKDVSIQRRKEFIEPLSDIPWLHKKPKLFFIQACATNEVEKKIQAQSMDIPSLQSRRDSSHYGIQAGQGWKVNYGRYLDFQDINYYADMLISYATTWNAYAAREKKGSIYVQTVVDQLKEYGHKESLENVLRRVHYNVNTIQLTDKIDLDKWKQTPYYECSLQKEFVFPSSEKDFL